MTTAEVRELAFLMWGDRCAYPGCTAEDSPEKPLELHHALINNSKYHKSRHPILLNSLENMRPVCHACHELHRNFWTIPDLHADCIEKFLRELKEGK